MSQMSVGREATHSPASQAADGAPSRRRWLVLSVLAAVAFMAQLDLFIVNVALPTMARSFHNAAAQRPVLGAQRLRDRVRGPAGAHGAARRPLRPQALPAAGRGCLYPGLRHLRGRPVPAGDDRRSRRPGGRGGNDRAHLARPALPVLPQERAQQGRRNLGRRGRRCRRLRAHDRRPAGPGELAADLPDQPADRHRHIVAGLRVLPEVRAGKSARLPDPLSVAALVATLALLTFATVQSSAWGWGDARTIILLAAAAVAGAITVWRTVTHPHALIEASLFRSRQFATGTIALFLFFLGFAAWLLLTRPALRG